MITGAPGRRRVSDHVGSEARGYSVDGEAEVIIWTTGKPPVSKPAVGHG